MKSSAKKNLIESISTPLGFFVLALLIIEGFLTLILLKAELAEVHKFYGILIISSLFIIVIGGFSFLLWHKPDSVMRDTETYGKEDYDEINKEANKFKVSSKRMKSKREAIQKIDELPPPISKSISVMKDKSTNTSDALIIVDLQNDFFEDGSLSVPEAESLIEPLNKAIQLAEQSGFLIIFTQDWHPVNHSSFKKDFKPHCIMDTAGAALHTKLYHPRKEEIVRFGVEAELDGFTPYENPLMGRLINTTKIRRVYVVGIALEYCVYATCKQTRELDKEVIAVESLIRAASSVEAEETWKKLEKIGVKREKDFAPAQ